MTLITVMDASRLTGWSRGTIYDAIRAGKLTPAGTIAGIRALDRDDVIRWAASR